MDDPHSIDPLLRNLMDLCMIEEIPNGHRATFEGTSGSFAATGGPNKWTDEMARKSAIFFHCLELRDSA